MFPDLDPKPVHVMQITEEAEGTEIWECPVCGRRVFFEWEPFHRYVDCPGDEMVLHSAVKTGWEQQ